MQKLICPVDKKEFDSAKKAITCWQSHVPELFATFSLTNIAKEIGGVSRERVRQIANLMNITERKNERSSGLRGKAANKERQRSKTRYRERQ